MNFSPFSLLVPLIGGLVLAALVAWIRVARLVLLVPRLFSYSALTAKGQLAEISVFNRGFKTEELIEVSLNPNLRYEVVGSNSQDVTLSANKILIPRLGAGDDVTTLVLVENGVFTAADITNCLSKESKGKVVSKLEDVPPTGPQRIQLVGFFVVFPSVIYLTYLLMSGYFEKEIKTVSEAATKTATVIATKSATETAASAVAGSTASQVIKGWSVMNAYARINGPLFKAFNSGLVEVTLGKPVRKRDILSMPVILKNRSDIAINGNLSMNSQRSQEKIPSYELSKSDIFASPGASVTTTINVVVPRETNNDLDKRVYIEYFLRDVADDTLKLKQVYVAE